MRRARILTVATLLVASLSGCHKSYVSVSFRPVDVRKPILETAASARFPELRAGIHSVAIRAPECGSSGISPLGGVGVAAKTRAILASRCTVWLGEVEAALVRSGFRVVPSAVFSEAERKEGAFDLAAAKVGADAVLRFDVLETRPLLVGEDDDAGVVFAWSNARGEVRGPAALSPVEHGAVRRLARARFRDGAVAGFEAVLDVTAVLPAGEAFWTYHRTLTDELAGCYEPRLLVRGRSEAWRPVRPRGYVRDAATASGVRSAEPARRGMVEDPLHGRLREIARATAAELAQHFASGT